MVSVDPATTTTTTIRRLCEHHHHHLPDHDKTIPGNREDRDGEIFPQAK